MKRWAYSADELSKLCIAELIHCGVRWAGAPNPPKAQMRPLSSAISLAQNGAWNVLAKRFRSEFVLASCQMANTRENSWPECARGVNNVSGVIEDIVHDIRPLRLEIHPI